LDRPQNVQHSMPEMDYILVMGCFLFSGIYLVGEQRFRADRCYKPKQQRIV
jgi:hypothetical protein